MHLMLDVETSLQASPPSPQALVDAVSMKTGVLNFTAKLQQYLGGCGLYHAIGESTKSVSAKVIFMAIRKIYGPRKIALHFKGQFDPTNIVIPCYLVTSAVSKKAALPADDIAYPMQLSMHQPLAIRLLPADGITYPVQISMHQPLVIRASWKNLITLSSGGAGILRASAYRHGCKISSPSRTSVHAHCHC